MAQDSRNHWDVLVIGAGMAGVSCAQALSGAGQSVLLLDKGRGIGGRIATRRVTLPVGEVSFDHGAQYVSARDDEFAKRLEQAGAVLWQDGAPRRHLVGTPGMSALVRALAQGLEIRQSCEVSALQRTSQGWTATTPMGNIHARRVVVTIPAPQIERLLGADHPLSVAVAGIQMQPCLTLMAAFSPDSPRPVLHRYDPTHPLAWIAQNSAKPARGDGAVTWVAQAGPDWSATFLEGAPDLIAGQMLPLLCDVIGTDRDAALHVSVHRWRYARAAQPLGQPFLRSADRSLYLGGDWCLGARVEDAWTSGRAIARDIAGGADVG